MHTPPSPPFKPATVLPGRTHNRRRVNGSHQTFANALVPPSYISKPQCPCENDCCHSVWVQYRSQVNTPSPTPSCLCQSPAPHNWAPLVGAPHSASGAPQRRRRIPRAFGLYGSGRIPTKNGSGAPQTTQSTSTERDDTSPQELLSPLAAPRPEHQPPRALAHLIESFAAKRNTSAPPRYVMRASSASSRRFSSVHRAAPSERAAASCLSEPPSHRASLGERSRASRVVRIESHRGVFWVESRSPSRIAVCAESSRLAGVAWVDQLQTSEWNT
ncbi:hypothetical protein C8R43DRAFT_84029 [Mycena crocata]|nr:hypothetical protein C8R43DRAFT_360217 [Mycena crocata]KAJ7119905.1 hypothetical protein C8R43DRAFT_84029 [Mycena crocata]